MSVKWQIKLKPCKSSRKAAGTSHASDYFAWTKSPPFAANPRGILIHRVRHVTTYRRDGEDSHHHVAYLCGNGCNFEVDSVAIVLVYDPPEDRLLCDFCESVAKRKRMDSGDKLAGRHVHRGVLKAIQTCCNEVAKS